MRGFLLLGLLTTLHCLVQEVILTVYVRNSIVIFKFCSLKQLDVLVVLLSPMLTTCGQVTPKLVLEPRLFQPESRALTIRLLLIPCDFVSKCPLTGGVPATASPPCSSIQTCFCWLHLFSVCSISFLALTVTCLQLYNSALCTVLLTSLSTFQACRTMEQFTLKTRLMSRVCNVIITFCYWYCSILSCVVIITYCFD